MTAPDGTFIGRETVGPAGFSCAWATAVGCRESDAMFVSGAPANVMDFGRVLLTTTNTDSLIVRGTIPVRGSQAYPTVGQKVYRTGCSTGTTSGRVARVCVNALVEGGTPIGQGMLCSVEIDREGFSRGGDSGSSVWLYGGKGAVITGITSYGIGSLSGFSPWGGVTKELGALTIR